MLQAPLWPSWFHKRWQSQKQQQLLMLRVMLTSKLNLASSHIKVSQINTISHSSVGKANDAIIVNTYYDPTTQDLVFTDDEDMNSCCTSCFSTPGCAMFQLITFNVAPEKCLMIITQDTCALPDTVGGNSVSVDSGASASDTIAVGNGICGQFDQVG